MTENARAFMEAATGDEEFLERLKNAKSLDEVNELAKEKGFVLTEEDFEPGKTGKQKLLDDELDAVAGGKKCGCFMGGGGESGKGDNNYCGCPVFGEGLDNSAHNCNCIYNGDGDNTGDWDRGLRGYHQRCFCTFGGSGSTK